MTDEMKNKLKGCLAGGVIGDAIGGRFEGSNNKTLLNHDYEWMVSDDTQLTVATGQAIHSRTVSAGAIAANFLSWFNAHRLSGIGSSTLGALQALQVGAHWALAGRSGEYAAGNGAAMRIAPLAFKHNITREQIYDVCSITHKNDEAYSGALAVYTALQYAISGSWNGETDLIDLVSNELPDTLVKDRLVELSALSQMSIVEIGQKYKVTGYVVDSIPIALFAAQKIKQQSFYEIFNELIQSGGDTDTTCSIAGQIMGSLMGYTALPQDLVRKYECLDIYQSIEEVVNLWKQ